MTDLPNTTAGFRPVARPVAARIAGEANHADPDKVSLFLVKPDRTCVAIVKAPAVGRAPKVVRFKGRTFLRDDVRTFLNGLPISPLRDGDIYVEVEAFRVDDNVAAPGDSAIVVPQDPSGRCIAYGLVAGGLAVAILHAAIAILSRVFA